MIHKITMSLLTVSALIGCQNGPATSELQTLDALVGTETGNNVCSGNFDLNSTAHVSWDENVRNKDQLKSAVAMSLSSVPKLVKFGFETQLEIHITPATHAYCKGTDKYICITKTTHKSATQKPYTLYISSIDDPKVTAVNRIRHSIVRSYGYYVAKFMGQSAAYLSEEGKRDLPGNISFSTWFQKANREMVKGFRADVAAKGYTLKSQDRDFLKDDIKSGLIVFPEAFDSFYCNAQTRESMRVNFGNTFRQFVSIAQTLESLERDSLNRGFSLQGGGNGFENWMNMSGQQTGGQPISRPGKLSDMSVQELEAYNASIRQQNDRYINGFGYEDSNWDALAEARQRVNGNSDTRDYFSWVPGVKDDKTKYRDMLETNILQQETLYQDGFKQDTISQPGMEKFQGITQDPLYDSIFQNGQIAESPGKQQARDTIKTTAGFVTPGFPFNDIKVGLPVNSNVSNGLKANELAHSAGGTSNPLKTAEITVVPGLSSMAWESVNQQNEINAQEGASAMAAIQNINNQQGVPQSFGPSTMDSQLSQGGLPAIPEGGGFDSAGNATHPDFQ